MEWQFFTRDEQIVGTSPISVLVGEPYDLQYITGAEPTSVAYTADLSGKWQMNADLQWIDCSTGENTAESATVGLGVVGVMTI